MCRDSITAFPTIISKVERNGIEVEQDRRIAISIVLTSGDSVENAVFTIGESICNPKDVFNKELGKKISVERAKHGDNHGAIQYPFKELVKEYGDEQGKTKFKPLGRSPITSTLIPHGLANRVKMLIPR